MIHAILKRLNFSNYLYKHYIMLTNSEFNPKYIYIYIFVYIYLCIYIYIFVYINIQLRYHVTYKK